jgi:citrate lyase subunit beta/citryl-CoA lyase
MVAPSRPRRSMLYMPASNPRALEKAKTIAADSLIFDLEDAVAPDAKTQARAAAVAAVGTKAYGQREVLIRVNAIETQWNADDLTAAATSGVDAVVLPKVNSADDVKTAVRILEKAGAPDHVQVWAMTETPRGVLAAAEIANVNTQLSKPRLAGLMVGTADLAKDLRCTHPADRAPMLYALQHCILAARAGSVLVIDGVHVDLDDEEGYAAACRQGREFGFDGKTLIHPKQVAVANATFAPTPEELDRAKRLVAAHRAARDAGKGVTLLDGRLVEVLHVVEAERLLAQAETIAALEQATIS